VAADLSVSACTRWLDHEALTSAGWGPCREEACTLQPQRTDEAVWGKRRCLGAPREGRWQFASGSAAIRGGSGTSNPPHGLPSTPLRCSQTEGRKDEDSDYG
jgi:hypothetical protein